MTTPRDIFKKHAGIEVPLICGPMFPCSNPELVAAVSEAGGLGMVQPITLTQVCDYGFREGLRYIRGLTAKPLGINLLLEQSFRRYQDRMDEWIVISLEEGVRFFLTALGHPRLVADRIHAAGGVVYHDVTGLGFAQKAAEAGVDGLICVNDRAGGHAGRRSAAQLLDELGELGLPLICAGGVGSPEAFRAALDLGYAGVQCGTRFIATHECDVHEDYRRAILAARADDIVLTEKISGVPVSVINGPGVRKLGLKAGGLARRLLRNPRTKHWMRAWYMMRSLKRLPGAARGGTAYDGFYQASKSVEDIVEILPAGEVVRRFAAALETEP
ncbi:nitronate monooxygenase [bacterium]|nr:nitronate monooxygenase [bacterium]MBU1073453.1 nitronate monooxygenase [bacterium]